MQILVGALEGSQSNPMETISATQLRTSVAYGHSVCQPNSFVALDY